MHEVAVSPFGRGRNRGVKQGGLAASIRFVLAWLAFVAGLWALSAAFSLRLEPKRAPSLSLPVPEVALTWI